VQHWETVRFRSGRRLPGLERPTRLRHVSANLLIIPYTALKTYLFSRTFWHWQHASHWLRNVVLKRYCACTTLIWSYDDDDDEPAIKYGRLIIALRKVVLSSRGSGASENQGKITLINVGHCKPPLASSLRELAPPLTGKLIWPLSVYYGVHHIPSRIVSAVVNGR